MCSGLAIAILKHGKAERPFCLIPRFFVAIQIAIAAALERRDTVQRREREKVKKRSSRREGKGNHVINMKEVRDVSLGSIDLLPLLRRIPYDVAFRPRRKTCMVDQQDRPTPCTIGPFIHR